MNLYCRLVLAFLRAWFRPPVDLFETFVSKHIVMPNDLDLLGHVNNGRYFTVTDYARLEWLIRAGLWQKMRQSGHYPVIAGETIQFRKPLLAFQRYEILSKIKGWDSKFFYVEHTFLSKKGIHALALMRIAVVGKGRPAPSEILRLVYGDARIEQARTDEVIKVWNESALDHWGRTRTA